MYKSETEFTASSIRALFKKWFTTPPVRKFILEYTASLITDEKSLEEQCWKTGLGLYNTRDEFYSILLSDLSKSSWLNFKKRKLKLGWKNYFKVNEDGKKVTFVESMIGKSDTRLIKKMMKKRQVTFANPLAYSCLLWKFYPFTHFRQVFRLDVVTTPENNEIVGWVLCARINIKKRKYTMTRAAMKAVSKRGPRGKYKSRIVKNNKNLQIEYISDVTYERKKKKKKKHE